MIVDRPGTLEYGPLLVNLREGVKTMFSGWLNSPCAAQRYVRCVVTKSRTNSSDSEIMFENSKTIQAKKLWIEVTYMELIVE